MHNGEPVTSDLRPAVCDCRHETRDSLSDLPLPFRRSSKMDDVSRPFGGQKSVQPPIAKNVRHGNPPAVNDHFSRQQPEAVTVVHISVPLPDVERLDRPAIAVMPAVDRHLTRLLLQAVDPDDVLLDAGD
jgi:hypothetical protein